MSALTRVLAQMKQVQQRCKADDDLLCAGYARISSGKMDIPMVIIHFVLAFFVIFEQWDPEWKGKEVDIQGSNHDIITTKKDGYSSVLCQNVVNQGKHQWTIKILKFVANKLGGQAWWRLVIGIVNIKTFDKHSLESYFSLNAYEFACNSNIYNGGYDKIFKSILGTESSNEYGQLCGTGDIIDIYLDFDKRTLSFGINNTNYGVAFEKIAEGDYRLAVSLTGIGTSLQLISYESSE